ncbi:MAG: hypothetical protein CME64_02110 [Halobacteriovoraceae bacterium]|nr:hypothetical protein [Halobacteriovoraceae bacterium]|tara:strand:+ start:98 stop:508 length:411 start_codon:yes stop_codon:yes gene_type:complete
MRKTFLINKRFQFTFIGYFLGLSLAACAGFYIAITYYFIELEKKAMGELQQGHALLEFLKTQQADLNFHFIITSLAIIVLGILGGLYISHKVAGPIHRLTTYLEANSKSKDCPLITFRKGDFFPELKTALNSFIKR